MKNNAKNKILLVEDDIQLAKMYSIKLKNDGFLVTEANNGLEAIESVSREIPDVILLDLALPKMSGFEVLKKLKEDKSLVDIPVVIITNSALEYDAKEAINMGAITYLLKFHFTPADLSNQIKELLGGNHDIKN
jgi:DNA-binding response OmpR family regulator